MVDLSEKDFEADDPYEFVGMRYKAEPGTDPDERRRTKKSTKAKRRW